MGLCHIVTLNNIFNRYQSLNSSSPRKNTSITKIILEDSDKIIKQISFSEPIKASNCLQKICNLIIKNGGEVNLSAHKISQQNSSDNFFLSLKPVINKNQVFNVAKSNKRFNIHVNRHLINERPLGMNIHIDIFNFSTSLKNLSNLSSQTHIPYPKYN